ncbi:MAG: insulinase family protein, partial [Clostridia bacterium]|nr:insulinase family protein [Clostridia bacterium]
MIFNYTLPNGIRLVVNKMDGMYSVSIGILVGAGSVNESLSENGISHFIEHVNFKGTEKRTAFQLSQDADMLGAQINAFTSKEFTCYYVKSIAEHPSKSFEILSDLFVNSVYSPEELDRERGVIIEEINMYEDTPDELCMDLLASSYFGDLGYGAQILGPKSNIQGFTRQDVIT